MSKQHNDTNPTSSATGIPNVIILAGGLGTRLRSAIPDLPKCLAPVAGKPFLQHLIGYLLEQRVESFTFSLGYKHEVIEEFIIQQFPSMDFHFSIEQQPLGTGGAVKLACQSSTEKNVLVVNGDTMFKADLPKLLSFHKQNASACTLALKPMQNFSRYGVVDINRQGYIQSFKEKQFYRDGLINGGVYALNVPSFLALGFPENFSFEKEYLERYSSTEKMMGMVQDEYFIDIGIPEDLARAGKELRGK